VTIATINFKPTWGNKEDNLNRIKGYAKAAAKRGANIIVFPEMALTGYDLDTEHSGNNRMQIAQAETIPGPSSNLLASIAREYNVYIIVGMPEESADGAIYNFTAVIGPDDVLGSYRKIHPFGNENSWCKKGHSPYIIDTEWGW
jgi:5-aminopentanamidase